MEILPFSCSRFGNRQGQRKKLFPRQYAAAKLVILPAGNKDLLQAAELDSFQTIVQPVDTLSATKPASRRCSSTALRISPLGMACVRSRNSGWAV